MMLSIQIPCPGCRTMVTGPWSCISVSAHPDSSDGTPPHEASANKRHLPSTSPHVIGTFESIAPGIARRGASTSRADGSRSCCASMTASVRTKKARTGRDRKEERYTRRAGRGTSHNPAAPVSCPAARRAWTLAKSLCGVVRRAARFNQCLHPRKILIHAVLRVDCERGSHLMAQPSRWRVVGHPNVYTCSPFCLRIETDHTCMCDGGTRQCPPRDHLIGDRTCNLGVEFDRTPGRPRDFPVRLHRTAVARPDVVDARHESGKVLVQRPERVDLADWRIDHNRLLQIDRAPSVAHAEEAFCRQIGGGARRKSCTEERCDRSCGITLPQPGDHHRGAGCSEYHPG